MIASAFLWLWIFQPQIGLMNSIISALAWVFFVIVLAITGFQLWTSRRWVYYEGEDN